MADIKKAFGEMWGAYRRAAKWVQILIPVGLVVGIVALAVPVEEDTSEQKSAQEDRSEQKPATESKPQLEITNLSPQDGDSVKEDSITVTGTVPRGARVFMEDESVEVDGNKFSKKIDLDQGENTISIVAKKPGFKDAFVGIDVERKLTQAEKDQIEAEKAAAKAKEREEFIASTTTIPYNQLEKNPEDHAGERVTYRGQIFQIQEGLDETIILLSVTDEGYGLWTDNIYVTYKGEIESADEDIITIHGEVVGTKSYETQIGGETYVPEIEARYIDE